MMEPRLINEVEHVTAYLICFALLIAPRSKLNGSKKVELHEFD